MDLRQQAHCGDADDEVLRVAPPGTLLKCSNAQRILLDADRPVLAVKP